MGQGHCTLGNSGVADQEAIGRSGLFFPQIGDHKGLRVGGEREQNGSAGGMEAALLLAYSNAGMMASRLQCGEDGRQEAMG